MESEKNDDVKVKSFRIPEQKYGYGSYLIISILLSAIFSSYGKTIPPHSLTSGFAMLLSFTKVILDIAPSYFFVFWIMDLIRKRGKVERPKNTKARLILNIIFGLIPLMIISSIFTASRPSAETNPQQTTFLNGLNQKMETFTAQNEKVKLTAPRSDRCAQP